MIRLLAALTGIAIVLNGIFVAAALAYRGVSSPVPSRYPNGLIAYATNRDILIIDPADPETIVQELANTRAIQLALSPHLDRLAYTVRGDIYVVDLLRRKTTNLTHTRDNEGGPVWSPTGDALAYLSYSYDDSTFALHVVDLGTSSHVTLRLADFIPFASYALSWSAVTGQIAFAAPSDPRMNSLNDIFVVNPDGSGLTNLTNSTEDDYMPVWSQAGDRIAFVSSTFRRPTQLYSLDLNSTERTRLTNTEEAKGFLRWTLDDGAFVYLGDRNGQTFLTQVDVTTADATLLPMQGVIALDPSPSGDQLALVVVGANLRINLCVFNLRDHMGACRDATYLQTMTWGG